MSQKEVQRLEVLRRVQSGDLSQSQAAQQLCVSVRQTKPTGASMKRSRREHGFGFSVETLRGWMMQAGLWQARKRRAQRVHSPRARRPCVGA